jgi:hypothetical protein
VEPAAEEAGENLAEEEAETVETEPVEAEESQADSAEETEEAVEEEKVEAKKESTETSAASITERSAVEVSTRTASVIYRVRYVDEETGEVVYQRNYSVSEETTVADDEAHDFSVTVSLDLETAALAGYALSESQEVTIRNNAIEAIVTEKGGNRNLIVNVRKDDVSANNNAEEAVETLAATDAQAAAAKTFVSRFSQNKNDYYQALRTDTNGNGIVYVTGDGLSYDRITYFGSNREASRQLWNSGQSVAYYEADVDGMFSKSGYTNAAYVNAGRHIAHQALMMQKGYGYEQGVDDVDVDMTEFFVLSDTYADNGYSLKIVDYDNNAPTGLVYNYETNHLEGQIQTGIENGGNYLGFKVALVDPSGNEVWRSGWVKKFNVVYQDETAPILNVTNIYTAVANENLSVQMVYPTKEEQEAAKAAYERGESDFYFSVEDNGWSVPYGTVVRDAEGRATTGTTGKHSYNVYYGKTINDIRQ